VGRQKTTVLNPRPNWDEQDMLEVWEAVVITVNEAVAKSGVACQRYMCIGVTDKVTDVGLIG